MPGTRKKRHRVRHSSQYALRSTWHRENACSLPSLYHTCFPPFWCTASLALGFQESHWLSGFQAFSTQMLACPLPLAAVLPTPAAVLQLLLSGGIRKRDPVTPYLPLDKSPCSRQTALLVGRTSNHCSVRSTYGVPKRKPNLRSLRSEKNKATFSAIN